MTYIYIIIYIYEIYKPYILYKHGISFIKFTNLCRMPAAFSAWPSRLIRYTRTYSMNIDGSTMLSACHGHNSASGGGWDIANITGQNVATRGPFQYKYPILWIWVIKSCKSHDGMIVPTTGFPILSRQHFCTETSASKMAIIWQDVSPQGLCSLRRHRFIGIHHFIGILIPIINLRWSSDRPRFMMGIPIPVKQHLLSE